MISAGSLTTLKPILTTFEAIISANQSHMRNGFRPLIMAEVGLIYEKKTAGRKSRAAVSLKLTISVKKRFSSMFDIRHRESLV
jgi:hypothetical protein